MVVADWLNDVLYVVDGREGCTLIGHVGSECPALVYPRRCVLTEREVSGSAVRGVTF